jgi:hypothetical protein
MSRFDRGPRSTTVLAPSVYFEAQDAAHRFERVMGGSLDDDELHAIMARARARKAYLDGGTCQGD